MPKTQLKSSGFNHKLSKNLRLKDNYISNDGGDEGITITDNGGTIISVIDASCLKLDGTGDYVSFGNILNDTFTGSTDRKFTLGAWVNPDDVSGVRYIVSKFNAGANEREFAFYAEDGRLKLALSEDGSDDTPAIYTADGVEDKLLTVGVWNHVGVTVNLEDDKYIIYKDGIDIGSWDGKSATPAGGNMALYNTDPYLSFDGIDDSVKAGNNTAASFVDGDDYVTFSLTLASSASDDMSVSFWAKPSSEIGSGQQGGVFSIGDGTGTDHVVYGWDQQFSGRVWGILDGNNDYGTNAAWAVDTWKHVIITIASGETKFYLNNVLDLTVPHGHLGGDVRIGSRGNDSQGWEGLMGDVAIYSTILTSEERAIAYNSGAYTDLTSISSITHWWKLNGDVNDSVGSSNGSITGSLSYIDRGDRQLISTTGTVSAWVRITGDFSAGEYIVTKYNDTTDQREWFLSISAAQKAVFGVMDAIDAYDADTVATGSTTLSAGIWYNIVGTTDPTNKVKVYVNGVLEGTSASAVANIGAGTEDIYIGKLGDGNSLDGYIDEVAIWNAELPVAEILKIYNTGTPSDLLRASAYVIDEGMSFDGSGDYIDLREPPLELGSTQPTELPLGSTARTTSMWIKPTSISGTFSLMSYGLAGAGQAWNLSQINNTIKIDNFTGSVVSDPNLTADAWNHIAVVYDGTEDSGNIKMYINGVERADDDFDNTTNTAVTDGSGYFATIGATHYSTQGNLSNLFIGKIREVAVFDSALSESAVVAIYNSGDAKDESTTPNLVGYWRFNENTGSSVADSSPNDNTGTVIGASWYNGYVDEVQGYWRFTENTGTTTYDETANDYDGTLLGGTAWGTRSTDIRINDLTNTGAHLAVGSAHGENPINVFKGTVDDVSVFNTDLDSEDMAVVGSGARPDLTVVGNYNAVNNLVGYWRFDEGITAASPPHVADQAGDNDGTIAGNPTWADGQASAKMTISSDLVEFHVPIEAPPTPSSASSGFSTNPQNTLLKASAKAVKFNGTDEYIACGDITDTDSIDNLSVAFWVNFSSIAGEQQLVTKGAYNTSGDCWAIKWNAGTLQFSVSDSITATHTALKLNRNIWYHIMITYSNTSDAIAFYLNGAVKSVTPSGSYITIPINTGRDVRIGFGYEANDYFNGKMQQVGIWDVALSATEVTAIYNNGRTLDLSIAYGKYARQGDLQAYWKIDEATGYSFTDSSANNNTGTGTGIDITNWVDGNTISTIDSDYDSVKVYKELDVKNADLKLSNDTNYYATLALSATGDLALSTAGAGTSDLTLDVDGDIKLEPASGNSILLDGTIDVDAGVVTGATSITSTAFVGDLTGDVTGDVSGTAATVTTAAQPAITSVGTLTGLAMTGDITTDSDIVATDDITIDGAGHITLDSTGGDGTDIYLRPDNYVWIKSVDSNTIRFQNDGETAAGASMKFMSILNDADYFIIDTTTNGVTTITTVDADSTLASLTLNIDGLIDINSAAGRDIILDSGDEIVLEADQAVILNSATGKFAMRGAGTTPEFSVANSAFAGMIVGYRCLGHNTGRVGYSITTSFVTLHADATVRFIAPPSGVVEVYVQGGYLDAVQNQLIIFGLSDNATYNSLGAEHENVVNLTDETDRQIIQNTWVISGLTAGDTYNYWFGLKSNFSGSQLNYGGTGQGHYSPFIMKVTALPITVADFAVYD